MINKTLLTVLISQALSENFSRCSLIESPELFFQKDTEEFQRYQKSQLYQTPFPIKTQYHRKMLHR
jgi:hypothetical protein